MTSEFQRYETLWSYKFFRYRVKNFQEPVYYFLCDNIFLLINCLWMNTDDTQSVRRPWAPMLDFVFVSFDRICDLVGENRKFDSGRCFLKILSHWNIRSYLGCLCGKFSNVYFPKYLFKMDMNILVKFKVKRCFRKLEDVGCPRIEIKSEENISIFFIVCWVVD